MGERIATVEQHFPTVGHDVMDLIFGLPKGTSEWRQAQFDVAREFYASVLGRWGGLEMADSILWAKIPWRIPGHVWVSCLAWVPVETSTALRAEPDFHIPLDTVTVSPPPRRAVDLGGRMGGKSWVPDMSRFEHLASINREVTDFTVPTDVQDKIEALVHRMGWGSNEEEDDV